MMSTLQPVARLGWAAAFLVAVSCSQAGEKQTDKGTSEQSPPIIANTLRGDAEGAGYPREWKVDSPSEAATMVDFEVLLPNQDPLTEETLQAVYVFPTGAVAFDYNPPDRNPVDYVRQEYIEVYEAPWLELETPEKAYEADVANDPDPAKSVVDIAGVPALVVEAHSTKDDERANPAFVRFVVDGIEVQLSGGEDLDLLLSIADSMVAQAAAG